MDGWTWRRPAALVSYLAGALLVAAGAVVDEAALFLLGLALLTAGLVLANW